LPKKFKSLIPSFDALAQKGSAGNQMAVEEIETFSKDL